MGGSGRAHRRAGRRACGRSGRVWVAGPASLRGTADDGFGYCDLEGRGNTPFQDRDGTVFIFSLKLWLKVLNPSEGLTAPGPPNVKNKGNERGPWVAGMFLFFMAENASGWVSVGMCMSGDDRDIDVPPPGSSVDMGPTPLSMARRGECERC